MKSFALVLLSVTISLTMGWFWHKNWVSSNYRFYLPITVKEVFQVKRPKNSMLMIYGYLKPAGNTYILYDNRDVANFKDRLGFPSLKLLLPRERLKDECVDHYVSISGKLKNTTHGATIDEVGTLWSLSSNMDCLPKDLVGKDLAKVLADKTRKFNEKSMQ